MRTDIGESEACHCAHPREDETAVPDDAFKVKRWRRPAADTLERPAARRHRAVRSAAEVLDQGPHSSRNARAPTLFVNPFRCRMWERHDRLEEYISEETCREEIASVQEHGQLVPVLARKLSDNPDFDFELIYGARRLFIARHLGIPLLLDVRQVDDREATVYIDIENRHRKDISPYERGRSFAQWLRAGLFANQREMARQLKISPAQVSRLLKLARLPSVIVSAFDTPMNICETWADDLWRMWDDPRTRDEVIARARLARRSTERQNAQTVFQLLTQNCTGRSAEARRRRDEIGLDRAGNRLFRVRFHRKSIAFVFPSSVLSKDQVQAIKVLLSTVIS